MSCPDCHSWNATGAPCRKVQCLACRSTRCFSEGLARGSCRNCSFGMLPGWSGNNDPDHGHTSVRCSYKGCAEMAVLHGLPGQKRKACLQHGLRLLQAKRPHQARAIEQGLAPRD